MKQLDLQNCGIPIIESTFVVLDCETTGLSPNSEGITELAAIKIKGGKEIDTFHTLLNPGKMIPRKISQITGITNEELKYSPVFIDIADEFLEFIQDYIIVGHNVRFDINFINASLARSKHSPLSNRTLDTLKLAQKLISGEVINYKLSTLASYCKANTLPEHRALADVKATIDVFHYLIERSSNLGIAGLEDLFKIPSKQKRSRFQKKSLSSNAPDSPGVYIFISKDDLPLYIGMSKNIKSRLRSYFTTDDRRLIAKMIRLTDRIEYIQTPTALEARIAEIRLLQKIKPEYNTADTKIPRQHFVFANLKEFAPTFRVMAKMMHSLSSDEIRMFGPFNSKRNAELFKDALNHAFRLRKCDAVCDQNLKKPQVQCINSLRGIHSCFCNGDSNEIEKYISNFEKNLDIFDSDFNQVSKELICEMNSMSKQLKFEKAKIILEYANAVQKWMNRFSMLETYSKLTVSKTRYMPAIRKGIAQVNVECKNEDRVASKLCEVILEGNNALPLDENAKFFCPSSEFRERFYLAIFLSKNNFLNARLNINTPITVAIDQKNMSVTTME